MLVAKVIPAKQIAFVSFRGAEIPKDHFEVLCGRNLCWRHCYNHIIPDNAVVCGKTSLGQPVYIGRGHYEGSLTVGKISSVHKALFIPFRGVERRLETYEILVEEKLTPGWQLPVSTDPLPSPPPPPPLPPTAPIKLEKPFPYPPASQSPCPYPMPTPIDPPPPYAAVGPAMPMPMPTPTPYYPPAKPACNYPNPAPSYSRPIPAETYPGSSIQMPATCVPASTYTYDIWRPIQPGYTPGNAVHAGHDIDMSTIYVCRAHHGSEILPGKAIPSRSCAYFSYQGQEIQKPHYELLLGDHYMWVPAINGFAMGAVEAGRTASGEPLYVGRAPYNGSLTCGKIHRSHNCLYIPFGGREIRIEHGYEILVHKNKHYQF